MMGRQSGQMSMIILDLSELIPENHLLRKINQMISFDFIYDLVAPYYPTNGRRSVDPVSMLKCCWWDIFTASSQNAVWCRKFN